MCRGEAENQTSRVRLKYDGIRGMACNGWNTRAEVFKYTES